MSHIREAENPLEMQRNGITMIVKEIYEMPHSGTHWFNKEAIMNIISLANTYKKLWSQ